MPAVPTCVYVADDHPLFLEATVAALNERAELKVVGVAATGSEALAGISALQPEVALLDMRLPGLSGQQVLDATAASGLRTRVLFLSGHVDDEVVWRALAAGAAGYLSKDVDRDTICDAVLAVAQGELVVSREIKERLAGQRERPERPLLTPRERAVLALAADGDSTPQIALALGVAPPTVKTHLQSIFHKLGVSDRTSAVATALREGLFE